MTAPRDPACAWYALAMTTTQDPGTSARFHAAMFGLSLLLLLALGAWWTVYISRSVDIERDARYFELCTAARVVSLELGTAPAAPTTSPDPRLVVVSLAAAPADGLTAPLLPDHGHLGVRPAEAELTAIDAQVRSRRVMVIGEGGLLFALIFMNFGMLWRMVLLERRARQSTERFVSAVTHELKTPLAGIKSLLQTLSAGRVPADQTPRLLTMGLREADRLEHTIENVLLSGRLHTRRYDVQVVDLPLRDHLDRFIAHRRGLLVDDPERVRLVWEAPEDLTVRADAGALRTILENLVDNGLKYGDRTGVEVRVTATKGAARVAVTDRGQGFSADEAAVLFAPFRRTARAGTVHGTGLGLSIARHLAARMGARLTGHSEGYEHGATFTVELDVP